VSAYDKVAWSPDIFLQPRQFQQETRHCEHVLDAQARELSPHGRGFAELVVDDSLLTPGRVGIAHASRELPVSTPFVLPLLQPRPAPIGIPGDLKDEIVNLAEPLHPADGTEFGQAAKRDQGQDQCNSGSTADLVLAITTAQLPDEQVPKRFQVQAKLGPAQRIHDRVGQALVVPAPRQTTSEAI
jgi:predicted component of type VI protein secretion system